MKIYKTLVLSTEHLKKSTRRLLEMSEDEEELGFYVYLLPDLNGFMLCMESDFAGVPKDLEDCLSYASNLDADWIRFDETEPVSAELQTYGDKAA